MLPSAAEQPSSAHSGDLLFFLLSMEQKQIAQGIKFGQRPPSLRKSEGDEGSSDEEEVVPPSPLKVLAQVEAEPANTEAKVKNLPTVTIIW